MFLAFYYLLTFMSVATQGASLNNFLRVCEETDFAITCPDDNIITITKAHYGRTTKTICPRDPMNSTSCFHSSILEIMKSRCDGRKEMCQMRATNRIFGDPCVGTWKYLDVHYDCTERKGDFSVTRVIRVCEDEVMLITCPADHKIQIVHANYGRTDKSVCRGAWIQNEKCIVPLSLDIVKSRCEGRREKCAVPATKEVFGDSCKSPYKYLEVAYNCEKIIQSIDDKRFERICDGEVVVLSCPVGSAIKITKAVYGRTDPFQCLGGIIKSSYCINSNTTRIMKSRCDGRTGPCTITASSKWFNDPCPGTLKYLEVEFVCEKSFQTTTARGVRSERACQGENVTLSCPPGLMISVHKANFGRTSSRYCLSGSTARIECINPNSLDIVKSRCEGRNNNCLVPAHPYYLGDICDNTANYLEVTYKCTNPFSPVGRRQFQRVCEEETMYITCPNDQVITVTNAAYGREHDYICKGGPIERTDCLEHKSFDIVKSRCDGRRGTCTVRANNIIFGDPCVGTWKYLDVEYECSEFQQDLGGQTFQRVCENEDMVLRCPFNEAIDISVANYGRTSKSYCQGPTPIDNINCVHNGSLAVAKALCDGKHGECTIRASNLEFGDPCPGTWKYLDLQYECKKGENLRVVPSDEFKVLTLFVVNQVMAF